MKNTTNEVTGYDNEIQNMRTQINILDEKIVGLLKERLQLVYQVREFKKIEGIPFHCPTREEVVVTNATAGTQGLEKEYLETVYRSLLEVTRKVADIKLEN